MFLPWKIPHEKWPLSQRALGERIIITGPLEQTPWKTTYCCSSMVWLWSSNQFCPIQTIGSCPHQGAGHSTYLIEAKTALSTRLPLCPLYRIHILQWCTWRPAIAPYGYIKNVSSCLTVNQLTLDLRLIGSCNNATFYPNESQRGKEEGRDTEMREGGRQRHTEKRRDRDFLPSQNEDLLGHLFRHFLPPQMPCGLEVSGHTAQGELSPYLRLPRPETADEGGTVLTPIILEGCDREMINGLRDISRSMEGVF